MKVILSVISLVIFTDVGKNNIIVEKITPMEWSYHDTDSWPESCRTGGEQSPINLDKAKAKRQSLPKISFYHYNTPFNVSLQNTGHSVQLTVSDKIEASMLPNIGGGALEPGYFTLDNFHFHWDAEHTINNYRYPLEGHFVHYKRGLENITNAINYRHGFAVIAVMYEVRSNCKPNIFNKITSEINSISKNPHVPITLSNKINIYDFLPRNSGFYMYNGSLTTPDCNEGAWWIVFEKSGCIEKSQLDELSNIYTEENELLLENVRPLQSLNGRTILYSNTAGYRRRTG